MSLPVHPRACGEQFNPFHLRDVENGSSPRLRGTEIRGFHFGVPPRFIPAPAGNSLDSCSSFHFTSVHPRACGEQYSAGISRNSSPGSSPRLRGTGIQHCRLPYEERFIPAPAGNRTNDAKTSITSAVHPRACGEQMACAERSLHEFGSSPRLRGTGECSHVISPPLRFIPAPAGNSDSVMPSSISQPVHPRACGEQHPRASLLRNLGGSSPRLRGTGF